MIYIKLDEPSDGDFRTRTPLYYFDCPASGRLQIHEGLVLARLTPAESCRVHQALCREYEPKPRFRLEAAVPNNGQTAEQAYDQGAAALYRAIALLAVSAKVLPEWPEPVVDQYDGREGHWCWQSNVGESWLDYPPPKHTGGYPPGATWKSPQQIRNLLSAPQGDCYFIDESDLDRWNKMVQCFPSATSERQLHLAAAYCYDALVQAPHDGVTAFLHASIALEALLGDGNPELGYRLALRGSHLAGTDGNEREQLFQQLRQSYSDRSKLVHEGRVPSVDSLVHLMGFLMLAVPLFAQLVTSMQGRKAALKALDHCAIQRVNEVDALQGPGWWRA